jgi:hypothetical protein
VWNFYSPDVAMRCSERFLPASLHGLVGLYARMCVKDTTTAWTTFRLQLTFKGSGKKKRFF